MIDSTEATFTATIALDDDVPIGARLIEAGLVTPEQLEWALTVQERTGSRLGQILMAEGIVDRLDLYRVLASRWGLELVDVAHSELDLDLLEHLDPADLAQWGWIPITRLSDGRIGVATSEPPTIDLRMEIEQVLGNPIELVATTDWDILQGLHRAYEDQVMDRATVGLWLTDQKRSARIVLYPWQKIVLFAALIAYAVVLFLAPVTTIVWTSAIISVVFLAAVMFKFVVSMVGLRREKWEAVTADELAALEDSELPRYTVLVPAYKEANVVAKVIGNLDKLDYPKEKLDLILLLEEDDEETMEAVRKAHPPATITVITVPDSQPKTKPKACNVGLAFARGEFLVIYDAEDEPEPDQLKKAVIAFRRADSSLVCVQAALNYWNAGENALTRMFTLEYSYWFDYMLPGLDRLKLPIPLGGTSNHFRTAALRRIGGWDPYNVTEDADLGIRVAAVGATVGVINSTTYEEANRAYGNWIRQRSRWIKGYLQTALVHLRDPVGLVRVTGPVRAAAFMLLVGGTPLTFLATPPLMAAFVISLIVDPASLEQFFPGWVLYVSVFNLLVGNALMIYLSMMGAFKRRAYRLVPWAILNPIYWLMHSIASYKALWQLVVRPHYWEKTTHGLSTVGRGSAETNATESDTSVAG
ncbi:MAG TPA: glycosyltransferase [Acidimicrobiia bacterium]|nr:glycosyltransferase [Acidimicrobiia bacterium]